MYCTSARIDLDQSPRRNAPCRNAHSDERDTGSEAAGKQREDGPLLSSRGPPDAAKRPNQAVHPVDGCTEDTRPPGMRRR